MPEKVKLPKFMCDGINDLKTRLIPDESPAGIADFIEKLNHVNSEVHSWIYGSTTNQWDLFDALRYGYEPEPEPRWGIKAGHSYLYEPNDKSFGPDEEPFSYSSRYDADQVIVKLGFGEVVDLNEEA